MIRKIADNLSSLHFNPRLLKKNHFTLQKLEKVASATKNRISLPSNKAVISRLVSFGFRN